MGTSEIGDVSHGELLCLGANAFAHYPVPEKRQRGQLVPFASFFQSTEEDLYRDPTLRRADKPDAIEDAHRIGDVAKANKAAMLGVRSGHG